MPDVCQYHFAGQCTFQDSKCLCGGDIILCPDFSEICREKAEEYNERAYKGGIHD